MTAHDVRETVRTEPLPRPRTAADDSTTVDAPSVAPTQPASPPPAAAHYPWPEPWGSARTARPRTEFWDVATAGWRSRGPVTAPPKAD